MTEQAKRVPPKGGRKGGTLFPKIDLKKAIEYNKKIVSKTHTSPQPESIILPGVFNNNGPDGKIRASALRQFGLLNDDNVKMEATPLGKEIASSPVDEIIPHLQSACLKPKLFKQLYETFKGDTVNFPKLKQQAAKLKVHPDSADECVQIFTSSLKYSGLAELDGDAFKFVSQPTSKNASDAKPQDNKNDDVEDTNSGDVDGDDDNENNTPPPQLPIRQHAPSSVQVNISLDPSMDPEKLEKLLKLLKAYGAI
ncbi:hypothetical protein SAMN04488109_4626 [Chryseolinea serpens]|uniref:Uncharacterized protein n=1 Tax=Chryseolinea serpens TaxID=947013 RepID=A0A1M5UE85_9BACT|nr:hypothetical protein [Chryseolinea serpens]SHH61279.1 hypothetical protein SAMN04488109_4626 [Chryseolinea serpens]